MEYSENSRPTIQQVVADHSRQWLGLSGVLGVGIGVMGEVPCIKVFFRNQQSLGVVSLPSSVAGYTILKEVSGEVVAFPRVSESNVDGGATTDGCGNGVRPQKCKAPEGPF